MKGGRKLAHTVDEDPEFQSSALYSSLSQQVFNSSPQGGEVPGVASAS